MKNQKEIYKALLAGETIIHVDGNKVKLSESGDLIEAEKDREVNWSIAYSEDWQIYTKPKWYENIPEYGVLCWVKDSDIGTFNEYPEVVVNYCNDSTHFFETLYESWAYAKPLTKQEIQVFMNNAPGES